MDSSDSGADSMEALNNDEDEEMDSDGDSSEDNEDEQESTGPSQVYMPGKNPTENEEGEELELECDESVYVLYHRIQTGAPCLSFDIIPDELGDNREDNYPMSAYMIGGTQSERTHVNNLVVMKLSNMKRNKYGKDKDDESDSEGSDDDEEEKPELETALIPHKGCVNRIKVRKLGGKAVAASWSELKCVQIWDLTHPLEAVDDPKILGPYVRNGEAPKPSFTFKGHQAEGFALDWSPVKEGVLASGDCKRNIHLWTPMEGGTWHVDQKPYNSHTDSVEDLQWSPNEANVLASCSVDRSIRIWDTRAAPHKACMLTNPEAHERDVNVISWNRMDPFIVSGGDDGCIKVWDIRQFKKNKPLCVFKHHFGPITSVEWHPTDSTVFAASGEDDQVTLWDLAVEKDPEAEKSMEESSSSSKEEKDESNLSNLPPQLLFIHQGQKHIKEIHWHRQMPGVLLTTAQTGFNIFRTISI